MKLHKIPLILLYQRQEHQPKHPPPHIMIKTLRVLRLILMVHKKEAEENLNQKDVNLEKEKQKKQYKILVIYLITMPSGIKITNESFKERAYIIHNMHKYSYDKVIVNGRDNEIEIFCNDCKEYFKQTPRIHLKGSGCQRCSYKFTADKKIEKSKKIFFEKIKEKDVNNNWDYSHVNTTFTGTNNSILLICNGCNEPTHRTPGKHLREFSACKKQCFIHKIIDKSNFNLLENIILEEKEKE